ncbi:hypothetical protein ACGFR8_35455 [Streptomyces brevispora]|uniref:hypothetical protein n=1 Tax=Streptomyces brevispora TaxID=887462 RepID=UPI0037194E5C
MTNTPEQCSPHAESDVSAGRSAHGTAVPTPLGALLAGALGTWAGVRAALVIGACLLTVPLLVLALSPLRGLRQMPGAPPEREEPAPAEELSRPGPPLQVPAPGAAAVADIRRESSLDGGATGRT